MPFLIQNFGIDFRVKYKNEVNIFGFDIALYRSGFYTKP